MKYFIWAIVFVMLLAGSGAGAYFYFKSPAEAAIDPSNTSGAPHKEKHNDEHFEYVRMEPLILPVLDENGLNQVVSLVVIIEVEDADKANRVETLSPRLKDAYLQYLYGALSRRTVLEGGVLRVDIIKRLLNEVTTKVLGENVAHDVLLQTVQQRPL